MAQKKKIWSQLMRGRTHPSFGQPGKKPQPLLLLIIIIIIINDHHHYHQCQCHQVQHEPHARGFDQIWGRCELPRSHWEPGQEGNKELNGLALGGELKPYTPLRFHLKEARFGRHPESGLCPTKQGYQSRMTSLYIGPLISGFLSPSFYPTQVRNKNKEAIEMLIAAGANPSLR